MIRIITLPLLAVLTGCETTVDHASTSIAQGDLVSLQVDNSLRIPAHRVKITMTAKHLDVEVQNRGEPASTSRKSVGPEDAARIKALLGNINWRHVARDDVIGLDGRSVRAEFEGKVYSVWTPTYQTEDRKLVGFVRLQRELFELAGLRVQS